MKLFISGKKGAFLALFFFILTQNVYGKYFNQKVTIKDPLLIQKQGKEWCAISGEDLLKHYKTNHIAKLSDGNHKQYASLRYLAEDWDAIKTRVEQVLVVDAATQKFIDASSAFYVLNSKADTNFTRYSKIAFAKQSDAKKFIKKYGGAVRDFEFVLYVATRDIDGDKKYLKQKKRNVIKKVKISIKRCVKR